MNTEHKNWQVETATSGNEAYIEYFIRRDGDDVAIASDIINPETKQPSKEIADLLCAAPDLLDALKAIISEDMADYKSAEEFGGFVLPDDLRTQARAVVAKAEGKA